MNRRLTDADVVWIVTLVGLAVADAVLALTGRELLTDSARRHGHMTAAAMIIFGLHLLDKLGPLDPFSVAGRVLDCARVRCTRNFSRHDVRIVA